MVSCCIDRVLFNYILLSVSFSSHGFCAVPNGLSRLSLDLKLFFSRFNMQGKTRLEKDPINIPNFSDESCDMKDFISDEFKKGGGKPRLEEIVKKLGYPIEKYIVETEDGYLLTLFRIKHGKNMEGTEATSRKPVMLQHGILDSAAVFLATATGMAYYLADKGYDVWIGNSRGTTLSRNHRDEKRHPDKKGTTFWQFSFHEMGVYDLPAVLGKIREETGGQRVHYIGMSMGTTQFLVMASEVARSLDWVDCVVLMAPVARPKHMGLVSGLNYFVAWTYFNGMNTLTNGEACVHRAKLAEAVYKLCISKWKKICTGIRENYSKPKYGDNKYDFENTVTVYLYSPAGSSVMTYIHYLQIISSGKFQQFDYGKTDNILKHGSKKPPVYNLKNINKKLFLLVGGADDIADEVDVMWLQRQLPSSEIITDPFRFYTHRDFNHGVDIDLDLYKPILDIFTKWESGEDDHTR